VILKNLINGKYSAIPAAKGEKKMKTVNTNTICKSLVAATAPLAFFATAATAQVEQPPGRALEYLKASDSGAGRYSVARYTSVIKDEASRL
jgi:hypothetical protein